MPLPGGRQSDERDRRLLLLVLIQAGAIEVLDGGVFLICSDGLSNEMHDLEIGHALLPGNCQQAVTTLLRTALERGARDNVTAVVIRAEDLESSDRTVRNPLV